MRCLYVRKSKARPKEPVMCKCRENRKKPEFIAKSSKIAGSIEWKDDTPQVDHTEDKSYKVEPSSVVKGTEHIANQLPTLRTLPTVPESNVTNLIEYKRDKLKSFMCELLLKKKQSILRRFGNLTAIPETTKTENVEMKTDDLETKAESLETVIENVETKRADECINGFTSQTFIVNVNPECPQLPEFGTIMEIPSSENMKTDLDKCKTLYNNDNFNCFNSETPSKIPSKQSTNNTVYERNNPMKLKKSKSSADVVKIRFIERKTRNKFTIRQIEFESSLNQLTISSKMDLTPKCHEMIDLKKTTHSLSRSSSLQSMPEKLLKNLGRQVPRRKCRLKLKSQKCKFSSDRRKMLEGDGMADQSFCRVSNWISNNDFYGPEVNKAEADNDTTVTNSKITDLTSVSRAVNPYQDIKVEEMTDCIKFCDTGKPVPSMDNFTEVIKNLGGTKQVKRLSKFSQYSPFQTGNMKSVSAPPAQFSVIVEGEESVCYF